MYQHQFHSQVAGIPCLIGIESYHKVAPWKGSPQSCPSDMDFYGYEENVWEVLDRKGYAAPWLNKKLKTADVQRIEVEVSEYLSDLYRDYED